MMLKTDYKGLVSVIMLNWNGYQVTRECLHSLFAIDHASFNVILVDNGSADNSVAQLTVEFADKPVDFLALDRNYGFTGGNNKGIHFAKEKYDPDYYLLLNNDTIVKPDFLTSMLEMFVVHDDCYAVVPKIYYMEPPDVLWFAGGRVSNLTGISTAFGINQKDTGEYDKQISTNYMNGCCALICAAAIKSIGVLDDDFFANSEDVDYGLRIIKAGYTIQYSPKSVIYHKVNYSFNKNKGKWLAFYLTSRNKVLMQKKHKSKLSFPIFFLVFSFRWILYLTVKLALTGEYKAMRAIYWGVGDGLANKLRFVN
jgi:GT2 family glycosyltransferase